MTIGEDHSEGTETLTPWTAQEAKLMSNKPDWPCLRRSTPCNVKLVRTYSYPDRYLNSQKSAFGQHEKVPAHRNNSPSGKSFLARKEAEMRDMRSGNSTAFPVRRAS